MARRAGIVVVLWLAAACVYSLVFVADRSLVFALVDACLLAAGAYVLLRNEPRRELWIALAVIAAVAATQWLVTDKNGIWLDETNYLATLQAGYPLHHGTLPFSVRWLEPVLAGPLNILPARGADALKAINFGGLVVAATCLVRIGERLGVRRTIALALPAFFLCSYLGTYAASNRLVVDPFNYALFAIILYELVADSGERALRWTLLVAACNSEKTIYWIPIIALVQLLDGPTRDWRAAARATLRTCAPMVAYFATIAIYVHGSPVADSGVFPEQIYRLGLGSLAPQLTDPVAADTTFQMLWLPFGAFTVFALLALVFGPRRLKIVGLIAVPLVAQVVVAHDAQRMIAYTFVVYLPLGAVYLERALGKLPRRLGAALFFGLVATAIGEVYLIPFCRLAGHGLGVVSRHRDVIQPALFVLELVLAGTLVWLHLTLYEARE